MFTAAGRLFYCELSELTLLGSAMLAVANCGANAAVVVF